jgi:hypothetical protein
MDTSRLDELIASCGYPATPGDHSLTPDRLAPFLLNMTREEFCDTFSNRVAEQYAACRVPFEVADAAMNCLWEYAGIGEECFIPEYSERVFEAFDAGEYNHSEDPPGTDPEQRYTRPLIEEIMRMGSAPNNSFKPKPLRGSA